MKGARRILTLYRDGKITPSDLVICQWLDLLRFEAERIHHSRLYCSAGSLSIESGISVPSVHRSLRHLEEMGIIAWEGKPTSRKRHPVFLWQGDTVKQGNTDHQRSESSADSDHDSDQHCDHHRSEYSDHQRSQSGLQTENPYPPEEKEEVSPDSDHQRSESTGQSADPRSLDPIPSSLSEKRGEDGPTLGGTASPSPDEKPIPKKTPTPEEQAAHDARMKTFFANIQSILTETPKKPTPRGGYDA